jgi:gas vesicle protein
MRVVRMFEGLIVGALLGAALVLLLTPRSGPETRQRIQQHVEAILAEGRQAAEERQLELRAQYERLTTPHASA